MLQPADHDNKRQEIVSLRYDAGVYLDEYGSVSPLAGKSVLTFFCEVPKGSRDPLFEFRFTTVHIKDMDPSKTTYVSMEAMETAGNQAQKSSCSRCSRMGSENDG